KTFIPHPPRNCREDAGAPVTEGEAHADDAACEGSQEGEARLTEPGRRGPRQGVGRTPTRATKKTRRRPLEEPPFTANRSGSGGGPLTSMASLFATTSASRGNLCGGLAGRKRCAGVHFALSEKMPS